MTGAGGPRHRGQRRGAAAALLVVTVAACGVDAQQAPEPVPGERLPSAGPQPSSAPASRARVWGARDDRLVPVLVDVPPRSVTARLRALLALSSTEEDQPPPSAIPAGTEVERVDRDGPLVVVELSAEFVGVPERSRPVALGQLVLTLTEVPGVVQVRVTAAAERLPLVDGSGKPVSRPLTRDDFDQLVTGGLPG